MSILPHPMLPPRPEPEGDGRATGSPTVRVLGQYKPERDLDALRCLADSLRDTAELQVHGRGWPEVPGWSVNGTFVPEAELDSLVSSSDVVLVPYKRFFQSGIAIRCLERGTPVVGPAQSALEDIYGEGSPMLVRGPDDWVRAVRHAIADGREEVAGAGRAWRSHCEREWSGWTDQWAVG